MMESGMFNGAAARPFPQPVKRCRGGGFFNEECPLQMKTHVTNRMTASENDTRLVCERTQAVMMAAAQSTSTSSLPHSVVKASRRLQPPAAVSLQTVPCHCCRQLQQTSSHSACGFCEKPTCTGCGQPCQSCQQFFCGFCAQYRYDGVQAEWCCLGCLQP